MRRRAVVMLLVWCAWACALRGAVADSVAVADSAAVAGGDTVAATEAPLRRPPPAPEARSFDAAALARLKAAPENQWTLTVVPEPTWWERFLAWLERRLSATLGTGPASWLVRNLWLIMLLAAATLVALTLRKRLFTGAFSAAPARPVHVRTLHEEVEADDLEARILEAEGAGAWRRALRLHYLRALRRLADGGHITLKPDATDRDYLHQVQDRQVRGALDELAFIFQWVWYGEAQLDRDRYEALIGVYRRFDPPARA